jgi:hypothetical protein
VQHITHSTYHMYCDMSHNCYDNYSAEFLSVQLNSDTDSTSSEDRRHCTITSPPQILYSLDVVLPEVSLAVLYDTSYCAVCCRPFLVNNE